MRAVVGNIAALMGNLTSGAPAPAAPHTKPSLVVSNDCAPACKEEDRAMPIGITDRIVALFAGLTREEVDMLPPVRRAQFAALCRHWANFADIRPDAPKSGVLIDLRTRRRDE